MYISVKTLKKIKRNSIYLSYGFAKCHSLAWKFIYLSLFI